MEWSFTNLAIQFIGGIVGGHLAAAAAKEHSFGAIGHTIAGALGGTLSGLFFQTLAATVVTEAGSVNEPRLVEQIVLQVLTGVIAGGIATLLVAIVRHSMDHHKSGKQ
jgi:flagellar biosynthesis protein FliR